MYFVGAAELPPAGEVHAADTRWRALIASRQTTHVQCRLIDETPHILLAGPGGLHELAGEGHVLTVTAEPFGPAPPPTKPGREYIAPAGAVKVLAREHVPDVLVALRQLPDLRWIVPPQVPPTLNPSQH